jgi:hypothetical protein
MSDMGLRRGQNYELLPSIAREGGALWSALVPIPSNEGEGSMAPRQNAPSRARRARPGDKKRDLITSVINSDLESLRIPQ